MSRSNWRYIAAIIGLVVAAVGSGVLVQYVDQAERQQPAPQQDQSPPDSNRPGIERAADALNAMLKDQRSAQEEERSRRDLDAQESAARWAKWAAWAAIVQLVISAVGICFVVRTLRQGQAGLNAARRALGHARRANQIAEDIGRAQSRAYLSFGDISVSYQTLTCMFGVAVELKNSGNSPAQDIMTTGIMKLATRVGEAVQITEIFADLMGHTDISQGSDFIIVEFNRAPISENLARKITAAAFSIEVSGKDVFGIPFRGIIKGIAESHSGWNGPEAASMLTAETCHPTYDKQSYNRRTIDPYLPDPPTIADALKAAQEAAGSPEN